MNTATEHRNGLQALNVTSAILMAIAAILIVVKFFIYFHPIWRKVDLLITNGWIIVLLSMLAVLAAVISGRRMPHIRDSQPDAWITWVTIVAILIFVVSLVWNFIYYLLFVWFA